MHIFSNPEWISQYDYPFETVDQVPQSIFDGINARLDRCISQKPLVSVMIVAFNEEINILRTISSLSAMNTTVPFEILAVNNNSTDRTQETIDKLHIKGFFQPVQGCGPARQLGQERAIGQYILLADADCLYPPNWLNEMVAVLQQPGAVCTYGQYSFIAPPTIPRWRFALHEALKNAVAELRYIKRPYLNAYGMSMGYLREAGLKAGYITRNIRGEDGRLCFDMMQYGRVVPMKTHSARVWTAPRTILQEGSLWHGFIVRVNKELKRVFSNFTSHPPHDTKTSSN